MSSLHFTIRLCYFTKKGHVIVKCLLKTPWFWLASHFKQHFLRMHDKLSIIDLMSFQDYNLWHHVVCIHRYWYLNLLLINALYLKKKKSHAGISSMLDLWIFIRLLRGAERSNRIRTKRSPRLWTALTLCAWTGADGLIDAVINSRRTNCFIPNENANCCFSSLD